MKKRPWFFLLSKLAGVVLIAFATYLTHQGAGSVWLLFRPLAALIARKPDVWIFSTAVALALPEGTDRIWGGLEFHKEKVQGILDQVVRELFNNKPKDNRCTLFRARRGYVITAIIAWRAIRWQENSATHLRSALVNPFGLYLYVYARAKGSRNDRSCGSFVFIRARRVRARVSQEESGKSILMRSTISQASAQLILEGCAAWTDWTRQIQSVFMRGTRTFLARIS